MPERSDSPETKPAEQSQAPESQTSSESLRILSVDQQIAGSYAAESAWDKEPVFQETRNLEIQHTLLLLEAFKSGEITDLELSRTVASRFAEKVASAEIDFVTDLDNRSGGSRKTKEALALSARTGTTTTAIMIDIDNFKSINDSYGHLTGDQALFASADHIKNTARESDLKMRWGGDEFLVVLPNTGIENAVKTVGDRLLTDAPGTIREALEGMGLDISSDISFSMGAAEDIPGASSSNTEKREKELTKLADKASMVAKRLGKNRLIIGTRVNDIEVFNDIKTGMKYTAEINEKGKVTGINPHLDK